MYCTVLYCTVLLTNPRLGLVTDLDLSYLDLTQESRRSLAAAVRRFRRIWMRCASMCRGMFSPCRHVTRYCHLTRDQLEAVLRALASVQRITTLSLDSVPLAEVSVETSASVLVMSSYCQVGAATLVPAVTRAEDLDLNNTQLSRPQLDQVSCDWWP